MKILPKMRPESYRKADELANNTKKKDETPQIIEQDNKNFHQGDVSTAERRIDASKKGDLMVFVEEYLHE